MNPQRSIQGMDDPLESMIKGLKFIPFKVFHAEPHLGYITDLKNIENPLKKVWTGELKKAGVNQSINLKYSSGQTAELKAKLPFIASLEGRISKNDIIEVQLLGIEKFFLVNPKIEREFADVTAYHRRPYIDSMLREEKVVVRVVNASDVNISAEVNIAGLYGLEPGASAGYDEKLEGIIAAEKAIIGYTLRTPEFEDVMPVASNGLVFSVLGWKQGISSEWQPLDENSYLRSGDLYKLVLQAPKPYYLYIFNIDAQERIYTLFPLPGGGRGNPLRPREVVSIPAGRDEGFILDDKAGVEIIEFYAGEKENTKLKELCERLNKDRGKISVTEARRKLKEAADVYTLISESDGSLENVLDYTRNKDKDNYAIYNARKLPEAGEGIYYSFTFHHIQK